MARPRILLADDELEPRQQERAALEAAGYQVLEAVDGAQLVALARRQHPALILADLLLPGMDGFEVITELKQEPATARIPILYLSTVPAKEAATQGVAASLSKPFERDDLIAAVHRLLGGRARAETAPLLIVDDERDITEIIADYLADAGCRSTTAYDGQEALAAIARQAPAAIILDLKMPSLDGYGVIRWVKRHPVHRRIPIIVLSAMKIQRADFGGIAAPTPLKTVPKPCEPARLVAAVREALRAP